jgi:hypothetical protein
LFGCFVVAAFAPTGSLGRSADMTAVDDSLAAGFRSRRESKVNLEKIQQEVNLENNKIGLF